MEIFYPFVTDAMNFKKKDNFVVIFQQWCIFVNFAVSMVDYDLGDESIILIVAYFCINR